LLLLALLASASRVYAAGAAGAKDTGAPPAPPPPKCEEPANGQAAARILTASDPASARRAEDNALAQEREAQGPATESAAEKAARKARTDELAKLARESKIEAFDPELFEDTRHRAHDALATAEERLGLAKKAWEKPPAEDELAAAQEAYCASLFERDQAAKAQALANEAVEHAAAASALSELQPKRLEEALNEANPTRHQQLVDSVDDLKAEIATQKERAFDAWIAARRALAPSPQERARAALLDSPASSGAGVVLSTGERLSWGVTGSLLRFRTERNPDLPGRSRNFRPRFELIPAEAGFQFLSEPDGLPWRLQLKDGGSVQIVSWGGMLLFGLGQDSDVERGNLSLAATLAFFENTIGLGAGFDLYRGIPIQGADGTSGGDTAFTGVLAWALAPEGEVTAENAFAVVTVNLTKLIDAISGKREGN
jgi:hypothetical protein